jgi:hypothetical protein
MPKDRELQFSAMAALQSYTAQFQQKMALSHKTPDTEFKLEYAIDIDPADLQMFFDAGVRLSQPPLQSVSNPDIILDFSDDRLLAFKDSGRHASQLCGQLCGVQDLPYPLMPQIKFGLDGAEWGFLGDLTRLRMVTTPYSRSIDGTSILHAKDGELRGVVGFAGWETFLGVAKGLPTVEIVPEGRNKSWLSKWSSRTYRAVAASSDLASTVKQAIDNLESVCVYLASKDSK